MSLWETVRREIAVAARSIGYDLRRRADASWGRVSGAYPEYDAYTRRPRRLLIGGGIGVVAAGGVAGTYLLLAGGLGGVLLDHHGRPTPTPQQHGQGITSAAHGLDSNEPPAPTAIPPAPAPSTKQRILESAQDPTLPTPAPSPSTKTRGQNGTPSANPRPSATPCPTPVRSSPQPTQTPTPDPTPSTSTDPTSPTPTPTASVSPTQQPDGALVRLSDSRSTLRPTDA